MFPWSASADTYRWTLNGSGGWETPTNWSPSGTPGGTGVSVVFPYASSVISLNGNRTVGRIELGERSIRVNPGTPADSTLILDVDSGAAVIAMSGTADSTSFRTISCSITGDDPIEIVGSGNPADANRLRLSAFDVLGDVTVKNNVILEVDTGTFWTRPGRITVEPGSALWGFRSSTVFNDITIGGLGVNDSGGPYSSPALIASSFVNNLKTFSGTLTLTANTTIGNRGNRARSVFNHRIIGNGFRLYAGEHQRVEGSPYVEEGVNTRYLGAVGPLGWDDLTFDCPLENLSELVLGLGRFRITGANNRCSPDTKLAFDLSSDAVVASMGFSKLVLDGISQEFGGIGSFLDNNTGYPVNIVGSSTAQATLVINTTAETPASFTNFAGTIGGPGTDENNIAFVKKGDGPLTLSGNNTYTGSTTISGGSLRFASATALPSTSTLILAGGTLDLGGQSLALAALDVTSDSAVDFGASSAPNSLVVTVPDSPTWSGSLRVLGFDPNLDAITIECPSGNASGYLPLVTFVDPVGWPSGTYTSGGGGVTPTFTLSSQNTTSYAYDAAGRLVGANCPAGQQTVYGYDLAGNLAHAYAILSGPDTDNDGMPDNWEIRKLGGTGIANASTDTDRDGKSDLLEYALSGNPAAADASATPVFDIVEQGGRAWLSLTLQRPKGSTLVHTMEASPDLTDWFAGGDIGTVLAGPVDNQDGTESLTLGCPLDEFETNRCFLRIHVAR